MQADDFRNQRNLCAPAEPRKREGTDLLYDSISVLIKPASGCCDMRCGYCFYRDGANHARGAMTEETARALVENVFAHARRAAAFAFQGGEPTLAGLNFFERFVSMVNEANSKRLPVSYAIQTNGLSLDEPAARFFARHGFLVGLSLDGTRELHDKYRKTATGEGSFEAVMRAAALLRAAGAEFNVLTVVTRDLCRQAKKVYAYYQKQGFSFQQFILCLEPLGGQRHGFAPANAEYARFLIDLFDVWYADWKSGAYRSIRYFDNLVRLCAGQPAELCSLRSHCSNQLVVEADGSCYPCDFYVDEQYRLGNIAEEPLDRLVGSAAAASFLRGGGAASAAACRACRYFTLCGGGCRRERFGGEKTVYCGAYRRFFDACAGRIAAIAAQLRGGLGVR